MIWLLTIGHYGLSNHEFIIFNDTLHSASFGSSGQNSNAVPISLLALYCLINAINRNMPNVDINH